MSNEKLVRRQYTAQQKNHVVQIARQHDVCTTVLKYCIARKNIQRWLKAFLEDDNGGRFAAKVKSGPHGTCCKWKKS